MEFKSLKKIDAHLHFNTQNDHILSAAKKNNFELITVNVDFPEFGSVEQQFFMANKLHQKAEERVFFIASFSMDNWWHKDWAHKTIFYIREALTRGAIGVKIWKNIGMSVQGEQGQLLSIDDPRLDHLFYFLEQEKIPLMMHQAEPRNCWLPLKKITMRYDRAFFTKHPKQHMYLYPYKPRHKQLIKARDNRLAKHPNLVTIQAHLASLEWDVNMIARFLDAFPNAYVDTAARVNHLMFQAMSNWDAVRNFFIQYQDRILYGSDFFISEEQSAQAAKAIEQQWQTEWLFLSTHSEMSTQEFDGIFKGLALPDEVLKKMYQKNVLQAFPKLTK